MSVKVTVVVENTVYKRGFIAEHGLSLLIEVDGERVLFDTGQGNAIAHNMKKMRIDPKSIGHLVLSHRHYDHTGGVSWFLQNNTAAKIYAHREVVEPCFSLRKSGVNAIGMPEESKSEIINREQFVTWCSTPYAVTENLVVTGVIPIEPDTIQTDTFYADELCSETVSVNDDIAMYITTDKGLVVVLGCCHSGVRNTLNYITSITHQQIYAVIGGMHLAHSSADVIIDVINDCNERDIKLVAPGHCTSPAAIELFNIHFNGTVTPLSVGKQLHIH